MDIRDLTVEEMVSRADQQGYKMYLALLKGQSPMTFEEWKEKTEREVDEYI